ncbi:hypothetical protein E2C01_059471 [Portunus trituberculatus]|uniref:Uncharacterized protein n=1 Tax=Portunus trituberculatus TaxID=210409 RepID=A0A5B7H8G4_PORTR|nr:hypothetical protein [Portunus trituberculatus]
MNMETRPGTQGVNSEVMKHRHGPERSLPVTMIENHLMCCLCEYYVLLSNSYVFIHKIYC